MQETTLTGYWSGGVATKSQVLDRTGLWFEHSASDVKILSKTYFSGDEEIAVSANTEIAFVTSTKVQFEIKA